MRTRLGSLGLIFTLCLLIVGLVPVVFYALVLNHTTTHGLTELKERDVTEKTATCLKYFEFATQDIALQARDYATWDETYEQVATRSPEWFRVNIDGWLVEDFNIGFAIILDSHNELVYAAGNAGENPEHYLSFLAPLQAQFPDNISPAGLLVVNGETHLVAASYILKSDGSGPPRGKLLIGSPIAPDYLDNMTSLYNMPVEYYEETDRAVLMSILPDAVPLPQSTEQVTLFYDDAKIHAVQAVSGLPGNTVGYLLVSQEQQSLILAQKSITKVAVPTMFFSALLIFVLSVVSLRITSDPIVQLEKRLSRMREERSFSVLPENGPREVSNLARTFNALAGTLSETVAKNEALYRQILLTDGLTGLPNRRYYHEHFEELVVRAHDQGKPLTVALIEINYLSYYIDRFGLEQGDMLVKDVADLLSAKQDSDLVCCRFGDGIFSILMYGKDNQEASAIIHALSETLENTVFDEGSYSLPGGRVSFSHGIASYPEDGQNADGLNRNATSKLFKMKQLGPNRLLHYFSFFDNFSSTPEDLGRIQEASQIMVKLVDSMDNYTSSHTQRVVEYSVASARALGWGEADVERLKTAALMHDIGKIQVGGGILKKEGVLLPEEWEIMCQHPRWGAEMVRAVTGLEEVAQWIHSHHEHYNGSGYPAGLEGNAIPMGARIITVADSFDAMTTNRPYRSARSLDEAIQELMRCSGTQFDPAIAEAFISIIKARTNHSLPG